MMKNYNSFSLFTLFFIVIFLALGTWQIIRKAEKEALLTHLAQSRDMSPQDIKDVKEPEEFQPLIVEGQFVPQKTVYLKSKTYQGKNGVYVLNVLKTKEGKHILVQRGWAAHEMSFVPSDTLRIEGYVRYPSPKGYFQPENKNQSYFWIDLQALSNDLNTPLLPFYLVAKNTFDPQILAVDPIPHPRNNHLAYAITWYLLAFLLLIMLFYGRNRSRKGNGDDSSTNNAS